MTAPRERARRLRSGRNHAWQLLALAGTVLFCACQTVSPAPQGNQLPVTAAGTTDVRPVNYEEPAATTAARGATHTVSDAAETSLAMRHPAFRPLTPAAVGPAVAPGYGPGFCPPPVTACAVPSCPPVWSPNEFICDGGDAFPQVQVARDWRTVGLDAEDTVAHYDTLDGHTCVEPSNRVCLYAPRFAAVRSVAGIVQHEQLEQMARITVPVGPEQSGTAELATTVLQPVQPRGQQAIKAGQMFRERNRTVGIENLQALALAQNDLLPYEDFLALQRGQLDNAEKARLAARLEAAVTWSHDQAVQVVIDNVQAVEASSSVELASVFTYEMPKGKPRLCLAKCASTATAKSGDLVQFTIRFQNVGDQLIGNVTILDHLSSRLEYVDGSEQCSLKASFSSSENDSESLTLRWEVGDPLKVGEGGVIHFQCRVR